MNNRNAMGRLSAGLMLVGATLLGSASQSRAGDLVIDTGASTLSSDSITNSGGLTKIGSGTLILAGSNTYSGATVVSNGVMKLSVHGLNIPQSGGTATAESQYSGRLATNAIDGSGMTPNSPVVTASTASNSPTSYMWLSNTSHTNTWIAFDLGATCSISGFHYWNYNESSWQRGIKTAGIYTGSSGPASGDAYANQGAAWGTLVTNVTLNQAGGTNGYAGSDISFSTPVTTRYIELWVTSNYGDPSFAGLSEILFQITGAHGSLPSSTDLSIASGACFDLAGFPQTVASLADVGAGGGSVSNSGAVATLTINPSSGSYSFSGVIGTNLSLIKSGNGTQILAGANTYTGSTTINNGMLTVGGSGTLGNGDYANTITNNAAFNYASSTDQILNGVISGTGSLIKSGVGTLMLVGSNTYSGATVLSKGVLKLNVNGLNVLQSGGTATAESQYGTRSPTNAINGSGMTPNNPVLTTSTATNVATAPGLDTMWLSANTHTNTWIAFDLGATYTISGFHYWNYNESGTIIRGIKTAGIYTGISRPASGDAYTNQGAAWGTLVTNVTLNQASGANSYAGSDFSFSTPVTTRYIEFWVTSNYGDNGYTGLSEILFKVVNGSLPSSTALSIAGGACFDLAGSTQTVANLQGGDGTLTNGTLIVAGALVPGGTNVVGTLSVSLLGASLIMADNSTYLGEYNATTSDVVCVNGQLNVGANCTVTLNPLNGAAPPSRVTLFTYGTLANPGNLATWTVTGQDVSKCRTSIGYDATSVYVNIARRGTTITLY